jgi:hypothetical protein
MIKTLRLLAVLVTLIRFEHIVAQTQQPLALPPFLSDVNEALSPGGLFDHLYDRFGNRYQLKDALIHPRETSSFARSGQSSEGAADAVTFTTCASGYFKLYFESGCGMDGNSPVEINRRNVICQVFSDISQFIGSPLTGNGGKVNIFVRDMVNMGIPNPSGNITLGLGSSFFSIPAVQNIGGIADNLVWQTIISGTDAYVNVASPLVTPTIGGGNYYHGMLSFNFANPAIVWNAQLASAPAANEYDLYTVALHEIAHSMGFGSLIDQNGQSKVGATFPYYSRYDTYLKTQANVPLITQATSTCSNARYGWLWNNSLSPNILQPGFTNSNSCIPDNTSCTTAINFAGSTVQPVYTPNCFSGGSTLSHFEDQCAPITPGNNLYFVMSNATGTGPSYMKRYFKPEERIALCDIGYSCGTGFGNAINLNNYTYLGAACAGAEVAGINDGINATGFYTLIGNVNAPIPLTGILSNDRFTSAIGNSFKCLQVISGTGNVSTSSGTSSNYTPLTPGLHLLRYIPLDGATLKEGNITYVFVYAKSGTCTPSSCDIVNNGGFENGTGCGAHTQQVYSIDCWEQLYSSPDYFVRNCTVPNYSLPVGFCNPASDTWNNGASGNNKVIGLGRYNGYPEGIQTQLSSNLMPGALYTLSFWAKVVNMTVFTNVGLVDVVFAGAPGLLAYQSLPIYSALPPGLTQLSYQQIPNDNTWHLISAAITNTSTTPLSYLAIIAASWYSPGGAGYVLYDDVSIKPAGLTATFTAPPPMCQNQSLNNLNVFTSVPNGTFSGMGVSFNATTGFYEFNAGGNLNTGVYPVLFTYTTNGCSNTVMQNFSVTGVGITPTSPTICSGQLVTLTANGAASYLWSTGSTNTAITVSPTLTTVYTLTASSTATVCPVTIQTIAVNVAVAGTSISPVLQTICPGQSATLTATVPSLYYTVNWNIPSQNTLVTVSPTIMTVYSVTGYNGTNSCTSVQSATVDVASSTVIVTPASQTICVGRTVTLTAVGASTYSWSTGSTSLSTVVTPTVTHTYSVVIGISTNTCSFIRTGTVTVSKCVGIENTNFVNDEILVYPNPVTDRLYVESVSPIAVSLYDASGKVLMQFSCESESHTFSIREYASGLYILKIVSTNGTREMKIIKED